MEKRFIPKRSREELEAFYRKSGNFTPAPKATPKEEAQPEGIVILGGVSLEEETKTPEEEEIFMGDVDIEPEDTDSNESRILMVGEVNLEDESEIKAPEEEPLHSPQEVDFHVEEDPSMNADTDGVVELETGTDDLELDLDLDDDAGNDGEADITGEDSLDLDLSDDFEF